MIVSVLLAALVVLGIYVGSHRLSGSQAALVVVVGLFGLALVVSPSVASNIAEHLGVGRGTDLLLYFSIIGGLFLTAHLYFRSKRLEEQIIALSRQIALTTPVPPFGETFAARANVQQ